MTSKMVRSALASALVVAAVVATVMSAGCQQATKANMTYPTTGQPRLVDLGTPACIPCALMAPGLEELKKEYAGRLQVEFIDTMWNPGAKTQYDAPFCATQIFIDASGKERFRHVGYYSKEDILAKWKDLGVDLEASARPREAPKSVPQPKTGGG
ncbi:MAG TPA: thioredoxin family protein [Phycisphaerae bacterium]|nr:thioredoxin family protein [Phycisphaerae bacterium]